VVDLTAHDARLLKPGRVYVGWRYAQVHADPGPPPRRPKPPEAEPMSSEWVAARRQDENLFNRPLKIAATGAGVAIVLFLIAGFFAVLPWTFAAVGVVACFFVLLITGYSMWQGERAVRARVAAEKQRVQRIREDRQRKLNDAHAEHARAYEEWEQRRQAYETQAEWYAVTVPQGVDRLDIAGGTLSGWSAMVTMIGSARLAGGSEVTVLDLTEGAIARDLVELARDRGDDPLVWVLPGDLPRLDLTQDLGPEALADVLSLVVSVSEEQSTTRDLSFDNSILERVLGVFGGRARIPQITAALRALAQVGDPRDDLRMNLFTDDQLAKITTMFGRGAADRVVIERAWALESQLRKLEALGSDPVLVPHARLRVVATDRRAGVLTNRILGTYVTTALTHVMRAADSATEPWGHTLFVCGSEKLRGDVLDRLIDACEATSTGLVLMYRSIPAHVRERLGRGHAAVGFMRLGNADDARVAAEHIGADQPLVVAQLTDSVGDTVPDLKGESYISTVNGIHGVTTTAESTAGLPEGIGYLTEWGRSTSVAASRVGSNGEAGSRWREFRVEPSELQQLPPTAMIFTHDSAAGRRILLIDANPGIITLPTVDVQEYEDATGERPPALPRPRHAKPAEEAPPPNLGPPPERLDFRRNR
jgi:hypothetical protein